jgi:hypothetical protein
MPAPLGFEQEGEKDWGLPSSSVRSTPAPQSALVVAPLQGGAFIGMRGGL